MYLLWMRNGPWAALRGFPLLSKADAGSRGPWASKQGNPRSSHGEDLKPLALSLPFRRTVGKGESSCVGQIDNLRMERNGFPHRGRQWAAPSPFPALRLKWQPHPHPWVFAVMTTCHQPGRSFPKTPSPSSTSAPLTRLADGTPPCPSADTGRLLGPVSMRGTKQKPARVLCARPLP